MIKKLLFAASTLGGALGNFALTGPAHAETFACGAFQCEASPTSADGATIYQNGTVCSVSNGQTGQVDVANLWSCVEAVTGKTSVSMHVKAQGARGRGVTWWNGGLAVTQFDLESQPLFPESGGILYYKVGQQPATAKDDDGWLLERPNNASFVSTTATPSLDSYVVLAGGGGSKGRVRTSGDGRWPVTGAVAGRGGWAFGQTTSGLCTTGNQAAVCASGDPGGSAGQAGGGGGGGNLSGGVGGISKPGRKTTNLTSEGGWGEFYGPAAYGAQNGADNFLMVGGEGGQGDGGGGGGGVYDTCGALCNASDESDAAAGGGGGSRALRTSIHQNLPIFALEARVELVFNHWSPY